MGKVKQIKRRGRPSRVESEELAGERNSASGTNREKRGRDKGDGKTGSVRGKSTTASARGTVRRTGPNGKPGKAKPRRQSASPSARGPLGRTEPNGKPGKALAPVTPRDERSRRKGTRAGIPPVRRTIRIRELVPQQVCGPRTRVHRVFRVEERVDTSSQMHLVFNDHHGWYCEHGTDCHAVGEVRKAR